ncbi:MAG TPA: VWA domain-containing protein [Pyrinomonadaceae bacterium]
MKYLLTFFMLFVFPLAGLWQISAQEKPEKNKNEKSVAEPIAVKANITVLDAAGNVSADDIKQTDLRIFEDGVEQKITYFSKKENVLNLGFVMDNTGSMRLRLEEIVRTGGIVIDSLTSSDRAFITRFVSSDKVELVQEWTADKAKLKIGMNNLFIEGGQSAVIDGLYISVKEKILDSAVKNPSQRYALLLISDCENRDSYYKLEQLLALTKGTDIQIFVLADTSDLSNSFNDYTKVKNGKKNAEYLAHTLALQTGGTAFVFSKEKDRKDMPNVLKTLVAEMRAPYVVGYTSTNQKRDGSPRKLTVEVADSSSSSAKGEKRRGVIRENFVVPKD